MKQKISITIEDELVSEISKEVDKGTFRNKSHFIEFASQKLMEEMQKEVKRK